VTFAPLRPTLSFAKNAQEKDGAPAVRLYLRGRAECIDPSFGRLSRSESLRFLEDDKGVRGGYNTSLRGVRALRGEIGMAEAMPCYKAR